MKLNLPKIRFDGLPLPRNPSPQWGIGELFGIWLTNQGPDVISTQARLVWYMQDASLFLISCTEGTAHPSWPTKLLIPRDCMMSTRSTLKTRTERDSWSRKFYAVRLA